MWIEGGRWQGTGDDICHVSGLVFSAVQQWNQTQTSTMTIGPVPTGPAGAGAGARAGVPSLRLHMLAGEPHAIRSISPGDVLQFLNRTTGELFVERRVISSSSAG